MPSDTLASDRDLPCGALDGLNDAQFLRQLLKEGQRTPAFRSRARILETFGPHRVHFFYLHAGDEVARIEVPEWVVQEAAMMHVVHASVCDQIDKGRGYPVALAEAPRTGGRAKSGSGGLLQTADRRHGARKSEDQYLIQEQKQTPRDGLSSPRPLTRFRAIQDRAVSDAADHSSAGRKAGQLQAGHVGEVVETGTTEFTAQARVLHEAPSFGRLVRVEGVLPIIGIVFNVSTHSFEPNRRPTAYGKTEEELRSQQPQIFELLRTEFRTLVVGYSDEHGPIHMIPPHPPRIHSFVQTSTEDELRAFTETDDFIRTILNAAGVPTDELLIAVLREAIAVRQASRDYVVGKGKELSRLLSDDYDRLSFLIRRICR